MPATNKIIEILGINNIAQSFRIFFNIFFNLRAIAIAFGSRVRASQTLLTKGL
jgi:hypothetical protein